jgi:ABC-type nitrate/sulfonate/bicarbonate transport system substrate-binding protein
VNDEFSISVFIARNSKLGNKGVKHMRAMWMRLLVFTVGLSLTTPALGIETISVGYGSIGGGMWPLVVAQKKGMLARNGIDATFIFIEGGTRALTAMVSGEVSFLHVGGTEAINAALGGADVVILSSLVNTLSFDLIVTPEIQRPENLKGKRLAISRFGSTTDVGLKMALKKLGFNPSDAAYLQIGSNQARLNAMLTGQVQGALLNSDSHPSGEEAGAPHHGEPTGFRHRVSSVEHGNKSWIHEKPPSNRASVLASPGGSDRLAQR